MNRLTHYLNKEPRLINPHFENTDNALARLAAYEDSGLEPSEIVTLQQTLVEEWAYKKEIAASKPRTRS